MTYKFFDTSSLLQSEDNIFSSDYQVVISSITLTELEHIKTSYNKDEDIKVAARKLINLLDENINNYKLVIFETNFYDYIASKDIEISNDTKILACAYDFQKVQHPNDVVFFVTNDLCLKHLAGLFFPSNRIESIREEDFDYDGYKEVIMDDDALTEFYSNPFENILDLNINEYLIIKNIDNEIIDR